MVLAMMSVTKINSNVLAIMILWTVALLIEAPDAPSSMKGAELLIGDI